MPWGCRADHWGSFQDGEMRRLKGKSNTHFRLLMNSLMLLAEPLLLNNTQQRQQQGAHPLLLVQSKQEKTMTLWNIIEGEKKTCSTVQNQGQETKGRCENLSKPSPKMKFSLKQEPCRKEQPHRLPLNQPLHGLGTRSEGHPTPQCLLYATGHLSLTSCPADIPPFQAGWRAKPSS